jgi:ubiquinone/menaquinone biosynthesis C-methylase UbiE
VPEFAYAGSELELFAQATNWKAYFRSQMRPYPRGDVLEVGAGIGTTMAVLCDERARSWTALEPDPDQARQIRQRLVHQPMPVPIEIVVGTTESLRDTAPRFDTILYTDVLEHIEQDRDELQRAAKLLKPGGAIVVLVPAHQWLFSPFDAAIGHFRRYSRRTLRDVGPPELRLERLRYLDAVGLLASVGNRFLSRQSMPTPGQIRLWDSGLVPVSRWVDPVFGYRLGKSLLAVWTKP